MKRKLAAVLLAAAGAFDLTGRFTYEPGVRVFFNQYLLGMSLSVLPQVLGQLPILQKVLFQELLGQEIL